MNDPNGTLYLDGLYYLSYQYNPSGSDWGDIQWAHATSTDLINWKRKGIMPVFDAIIKAHKWKTFEIRYSGFVIDGAKI